MASVETRTRANGTAYRVVWWEGPTRQQQTFPTRPEADKFRSLVEGSGNRWPHGWIKGQGFIAVDSTAPLFRDWAARCIASRTRANERTQADYLRDLRLHAYPALGDRHLDLITRTDIADWLRTLLRSGLAAKTVQNVHGTVSSILTEAVHAGLIPRNPATGTMTDLPTVKTEDMTFLLPSEVKVLTSHVPEHYRGLVTVLFGTGLRWSEATALQVGDVDLFDRKTMTVVRAWKRDDAGRFYLGEPKTRRSRRTLSISGEVVEAVIPLISGRNADEFLFTTLDGRPVLHSNFYNRVWLPSVVRAQQDSAAPLRKTPRIHDARHSHVAWLISAGVPLPAIQRRLGHASITTTIDRYGHLMPEMDGVIDAAVDGALRPVSVPGGTA